jgi:hypothetical protein
VRVDNVNIGGRGHTVDLVSMTAVNSTRSVRRQLSMVPRVQHLRPVTTQTDNGNIVQHQSATTATTNSSSTARRRTRGTTSTKKSIKKTPVKDSTNTANETTAAKETVVDLGDVKVGAYIDCSCMMFWFADIQQRLWWPSCARLRDRACTCVSFTGMFRVSRHTQCCATSKCATDARRSFTGARIFNGRRCGGRTRCTLCTTAQCAAADGRRWR